MGLRERKKLDTRRALSDAALALMFERGLENVRREDIAARAGVSIRTFNNYFDGLADAVAYRAVERVLRSVDLLRERPADEPLWQAISRAVVRPFEEDGAESHVATQAQKASIRALLEALPVQTAVSKGVFDELVAVIAERTGTDPVGDLYPRLAAGAVEAAYRAASHAHAYSPTDEPITVSLRRAIDLIAAGLPDPSTNH